MEEGPSCSRKKRDTCTYQRQEDIINVATVIRQEMMDHFDLFNVAEKTARYLRLGVNTVRRYYNQKIDNVETPGKTRRKQPRPGVSVETLDDFTRDFIRQVIYRMYHEVGVKNVDHCERLIKEDWDREMKMDASETHPPIIINLAEDDEDDDDEYDDVDEVLATPLENT